LQGPSTLEIQDDRDRFAEARRAEAHRSLESLMIAVPLFRRDELTRLACLHYNGLQLDWAEERGWGGPILATRDSDPAFLVRITVGFLRQALNHYERELESAAGTVGAGMVHWALRHKLLETIASAYPWLTDECRRQSGEPIQGPLTALFAADAG
jgi:hypothetical protein